jgi:hypothetical protein
MSGTNPVNRIKLGVGVASNSSMMSEKTLPTAGPSNDKTTITRTGMMQRQKNNTAAATSRKVTVLLEPFLGICGRLSLAAFSAADGLNCSDM